MSEPAAPGPAPDRWRELGEVLDRTLVCLDFDGTLSPIVDDPDRAVIHPDAPPVLRALLGRVLAVAVVTGRPVRQVLELGDLERLADSAGRGRLEIRGQYGHERWSSARRRIVSPEPPEALLTLRERLPELLRGAGLEAAYVEEKGLALAVHTRRLPEPDAAATAAFEALAPVAQELGLAVEPGRRVVELRVPGTDKGAAVEDLVEDLDPAAVVFVGDDLGDLAAFEAVERWRTATGRVGLLVCSGSQEQEALAERADVVVAGPAGVVGLLRDLAG